MLENNGDVNPVNLSTQEASTSSESYIVRLRKSGKYRCRLCNVQPIEEKSIASHLNGKKHHNSLQNLTAPKKKNLRTRSNFSFKSLSENSTAVRDKIIEKNCSDKKIKLLKDKTINKKSSRWSKNILSKSTNEKPLKNILIEESKSAEGRMSESKTVKSLSLKRGSTTNSKNQGNSSANMSDDYMPFNYPPEYQPNYKMQRNKWNRDKNSWNYNEIYNYYNDTDYRDFNNESYYQYRGKNKRYFYQDDQYRNRLPAYREDNSRNYWNGTYFSESDPPDMHFANMQYGKNDCLNFEENEACNEALEYQKYGTKQDFVTDDNNDHFSTRKRTERNSNELVKTDKDFDSKRSTTKKLSSPQNCPSPRTISVSSLAHAKADSSRQSRTFKKGGNSQNHNNSGSISVPISNNNTEIESSNYSDKQQDKRLPPENMSDRISHWLNPLNSRDKAEINKLMNNYSKSKKKETLLKLKHRSEDNNTKKDGENNENLFHNLEELTDRINTAESEIEQNNDISPDPSHCLGTSSDNLISSDKTEEVMSPKPKRRKKSNHSESSCNSMDVSASSRPPRKSSIDKDTRNSKKRCIRASRASTDSSMGIQGALPVTEYEMQFDELVLDKRRSSLSLPNKSKKHKCSGSECAIECAYEGKSNSEESLNMNDNVDKEMCDASMRSSQNCEKTGTSQTESLSISSFENAQILDVEDLMKMFALENVTIKKEFDDPLIEAIKNVDVNFLMNVCDSKTATNNPSSLMNSSPCIKSNYDNQLNKCDGVVESPMTTLTNTSDKETDKSVIETPLLTHSVTNLSENQLSNSPALTSPSTMNICDMQINNPEKESLQSISNAVCVSKPAAEPTLKNTRFESFETALPGLSPFKVYVNISNELNKLQKEEEEKRDCLKEIDKMMDKHQRILNELTAKKIKLQAEEENLISRRKTLTCALSQCIISDSYAVTVDADQTSKQPSEDKKAQIQPIDSTLVQVVNQLPKVADVWTLCSSSTSTTPVSNVSETNTVSLSNDLVLQKEMSGESAKQCELEVSEKDFSKDSSIEDSEEIIVIPVEKKIVPVIDLVDADSPTKNKNKEKSDLAQNFTELIAHKTVVNSVKVHNGYLYTCSNDYTAKRFNLKDSEDMVLYKHTKRNVLQLCIEAYNDNIIVFTLCSLESRISSFNAEDGNLLKTYSFESICAGISNGWGKVFAGLKNGLIVACNRKDSKDLVRNLEPVKSLACTMQGGLRVIIVLSVSGQVAVRDIERNGLLIRYIKAHNDTPLFMNVYNDYVYLSSSVLLTATNLSTGNVERKLKLTSPITGLAAFESNIFTTAFSGIVRCYHGGRILNMKMAYGAGHESLTCIYVHQGWVFTGNRNGVVSVFQFDPTNEYHCQVSNCKNVYIHLEDLDRHVNISSDHKLTSKNIKCPWRKCQQTIKDWSDEDKKNHLKSHITAINT